MYKKTFVFQAPVETVSGYGAHSRDLAYSLLKILNPNEWEFIIIPTRWGDTPRNFLQSENPDHYILLKHFISQNLTKQPEVFFQVSVPNEATPIGKFNIMCTAGIETTMCSAQWIEGLNKMDLIIVPSKHAKDVFLSSKWQKQNAQTKQIEGELVCTKPIEVLFEGYDETIYKCIAELEIHQSINEQMKLIKENFCYLYVGHWIKGDFGHDRKDVATLIKCHLQAWSGIGNAPALILKTSSANFSIIDREQILNKIDSIRQSVMKELNLPLEKMPNIYLLHGSLSDSEMNSLYNHPKVKAFVSFTKGEGYGRPLAEFSVTGKPIIASGWSGHLDFLHPNHTVLVGGKVQQIHPSAVWENVLIPQSGWFYIDEEAAKSFLKDVRKNYDKYLERSRGQASHIKNYTLDKMTELLSNVLEQRMPKFALPIELKLPDLPSLPELK